ncbi:sulfate permease [Gulosibacter macacae]|uniref:sulfate permease n=1 Tax=Gulosibacter macacae TaxID=2488791 RepID=UPI001F3BBB04|nr:sulfate permease [Gulosibacter macacae]
MLRLIWTLSVHTRIFLRRYMPTNRLLDAIRTRRGLKWGVPAMLLAIPYLLAAAVFRDLIEGGGPGWLNLLVLLCIWNSMKLTIIGPVSMVLLLRAKAREHIGRRRSRRTSDQLRGEPQVPDTKHETMEAIEREEWQCQMSEKS